MGGSFIEPVTLVDVGYSISRFYQSPAMQREAGIFQPWVPAQKLLAALLHVDDAVVPSRVYCVTCLETVQKTWPKEVGALVAGTSPEVEFLATNFRVINGRELLVSLLVKNFEYVAGCAKYAHVCRIQPFMGASIHTQIDACRFILPHVLTANKVTLGHIGPAAESSASKVVGLSGLWPARCYKSAEFTKTHWSFRFDVLVAFFEHLLFRNSYQLGLTLDLHVDVSMVCSVSLRPPSRCVRGERPLDKVLRYRMQCCNCFGQLLLLVWSSLTRVRDY